MPLSANRPSVRSPRASDLGGMPDRPRYLTPDTKDRELASWMEARGIFLTQFPVESRAGLGGRGYPDPEMFEWCDLLNATFPGVCTLQSCCGHALPEYGSVHAPGSFWLWLSQPMSRMFNRFAFDLARQPCMERVTRIYHDVGQEIADLQFKGLERGVAQFHESINVIVAFFRKVHLQVLQDRIGE